MRRVVQLSLGVVPRDRPLTLSQREFIRRAGTVLSLQQRIGERRVRQRAEAEHEKQKKIDRLAYHGDYEALAKILPRLRKIGS